MFAWLKRLWQKQPPTIRTFEELAAAIKSGAIQPQLHHEGEVQVMDLFAQTGLSAAERKKVMLRSFPSPAGIRMYVHNACAAAYLAKLPATHAVYEKDTERWMPNVLIGRYRDVTHCDECSREFQLTDEGYMAYWIVSREDLRLLAEVQREPATEAARRNSNE